MRRDVATEDLAVVVERGIGAEDQHVAHAPGFVAAVLLAQAGFGGDQVADFLGAGDDDVGGLEQDAVAFVTGECRSVGAGNLEGAAHVVDACLGHRADAAVGIGVENLDDAVPGDAFAADTHGFLAKLHPGGLRVSMAVVTSIG